MSNADLISRGLEAFNAHDAEGLRAVMSAECVCSAPGGMVFEGVDACIQFNQTWWEAFPDASVRVTGLHDAGEYVTETGIFSGTHRGVLRTPMGDIPPTGRSVEGPYIQVFRVRGDRIVEQNLMFDRMNLMEQLGLTPAPAAAR